MSRTIATALTGCTFSRAARFTSCRCRPMRPSRGSGRTERSVRQSDMIDGARPRCLWRDSPFPNAKACVCSTQELTTMKMILTTTGPNAACCGR